MIGTVCPGKLVGRKATRNSGVRIQEGFKNPRLFNRGMQERSMMLERVAHLECNIWKAAVLEMLVNLVFDA